MYYYFVKIYSKYLPMNQNVMEIRNIISNAFEYS